MKLEHFSSVVCWRLLNSFNTQVSGIQFNCPLSLLLPGVKPCTHISHFAVEDHHWLLWGQHFTYPFPPWKKNSKNLIYLKSLCVQTLQMLFYPYQMLRVRVAVSDTAEFVQLFWCLLCVWLFWVEKYRESRTSTSGFEILACHPHPLPSIQLQPKTNSLWGEFHLVLQVPQISPMLYLSGLSIFSHCVGYKIDID